MTHTSYISSDVPGSVTIGAGDEHVAWADGQRVPVVSPEDRSGEELIHKCCADLCVNSVMAEQIIAWADENMSPAMASAAGTAAGFSTLHQTIALEKVFRVLLGSDNAWLCVRMLAYALNIPAIDEALNFQTPADFARRADMTRENAKKMLHNIQDKLSLPLRKGQKTPAARARMRAARLRQLSK